MILLSILLGFIVRRTDAGTWVLVGDRGKFRKTVKKQFGEKNQVSSCSHCKFVKIQMFILK